MPAEKCESMHGHQSLPGNGAADSDGAVAAMATADHHQVGAVGDLNGGSDDGPEGAHGGDAIGTGPIEASASSRPDASLTSPAHR